MSGKEGQQYRERRRERERERRRSEKKRERAREREGLKSLLILIFPSKALIATMHMVLLEGQNI